MSFSMSVALSDASYCVKKYMCDCQVTNIEVHRIEI